MTRPLRPLAPAYAAGITMPKAFLWLFLPLAACVVGVAIWLGHSRIEEEVREELEAAAHRAEIGATLFARRFDRPLAHLASLAGEGPVRAAVGQAPGSRLDVMATAFQSLMQRNSEYDQVRWIDHAGRERVRINRTDQGPMRVPDVDLQDKSDRDYFKASVNLPPGQIYLSAIDLNIERGMVERPYKPMLRLATPALDALGQQDGVLVINILMAPLLDSAVIHGVTGAGDISVLNARGYWLRALDPGDEWGFVLGRDTALASRSPALWERVVRQERGQWPDGDGLWAWHTVQSPVAGSADAPWFVLARQPLDALHALEREVWVKGVGIVVALLVLLGLLCRNVVLRRAQRDAALIDLGRSEAEAAALREHVAEARRHEAVSALLAAIVNSAEDAIFSTTSAGLISSWNPGAERLLGYSGEDVIGRPVTFLYPPEGEGGQPPQPAAVAGGEAVHRVETTLRHRAGHGIDVAATWSPIRDRDGRRTGSSCIVHDVREERRVARELQLHREHLENLVSRRTADLAAAMATVEERESFFRTITDNLPGMVSYWDHALRCRFANRAYGEWFGRNPDEMIGISLRDLLGEETFEHSRPYLEATLRGSPQRFERTMRKVDGSTGHAMVHMVPDGRNGQVSGLFALVADVTPVKEAELRLRQANAELSAALTQAASATAAKSAFLANMSHEIRTPMNAILGMAFLLEKADLPPEAGRVAQRIHHAGRALLTILNDILDFSRIESGHLALEQEPFRLEEVFDNLATIMAGAAAQKDVELAVAPPPADLGPLLGDALRLGQVLINLTSNAVKFTERGHVTVGAEVMEETSEEVTLRFAVRDTGVGIPVEKQDEIFNPFSQADASTTRRSGGTGLGLAICRRLVTLMGGEIGVHSRPGAGSEFWFTLHARRGDQATLPAPGPALEVLVADDNPATAEAVADAVRNLGWKAERVGGGEAALSHVLDRLADHGREEVILLDWEMPGLDGLATAGALREALDGRPWTILLMIGPHARQSVAGLPGLEAVDGVLDKPVTAASLHAAVIRARGGAAPVPAAAPPAAERLAGVRILVVDDSEINREVAQAILVHDGAHVELAGDGRQALELLQARPADFDIVLMDVQMPVMDGHEATRAIRRDPALAALPVVAVTAGAFKVQEEAARAAGMDDFVAKPFDVDAIVALIRRLVAPPGEAQCPASVPALPRRVAAVDPGEAYPGIDLSRALAMWKDAEVYRNFLRQFAADYGGCMAVLRQGDAAASEALAHRLKGAAGSLRLDDVAACAGRLDQALRKGEPAGTLMDALQAALDTALASIRRYAPEAAKARPSIAAVHKIF